MHADHGCHAPRGRDQAEWLRQERAKVRASLATREPIDMRPLIDALQRLHRRQQRRPA
jgi:hypothetical protein